MTIAQEKSALLIQRQLRGYFVAKRFVREKGDISIMNSLKSLRDMKHELGVMLSNLLRFHWKVYKRRKEKKKKKKKKGAKGKGKSKL